MDSRPRLHGGRLCVGITGGMGPRIREDNVYTEWLGSKLKDGSPHARGQQVGGWG